MSENRNNRKPPRRGGGPGPGGHGGMPIEKAKDFKGSFRRLVRYLSEKRVALIIVMLMAAGSSIFAIFGPKILGTATTELFASSVMPMYVRDFIATGELPDAVDEERAEQLMESMPPEMAAVLANRENLTDEQIDAMTDKIVEQAGVKIDFDKILRILLMVAGLYLVSSMLAYIQQLVMAYTSQRIVYKMRNQVKIKLTKLPLKYFDGKTHGDILSRVTNDIDTIANTLQQGATQVITAVATILGILVMMFTISWVLTLVSLVVLPLSVMLTQAVVKRSQKHFKNQQEELGNINGHVEEMYTGHKIIKAFGKEQDSLEEFDKINHRLYTAGWKSQFLSGLMWPLMNLVNNFSYVFVCVIGGILAINGRITVGDVQAFIQYSRRFTQPIAQTAQIANVMQAAIAAAERVFEILDEDEQIPDPLDGKLLHYPKGSVTFDHVKFGYDPEKTIIKDMNLHVNPGDVVAIVGPTGAGKTTLVNLLMRFYEIDDGCITIDGIDTRDMARSQLRKSFGMVLQDTWLFNGSIRDNIAYGRPDATDDEIIEASKMAHADHFIRTLPEGYDTILKEDATNISQGQRQLLTIARALLSDPTILILDEATSSVDTRTEAYIQNAMIALMEGRTSFVIAHRLSTIRNASTILVMNEGEVIEQGNHQQLMAKQGFYAELYNAQFAGADLRDDVG